MSYPSPPPLKGSECFTPDFDRSRSRSSLRSHAIPRSKSSFPFFSPLSKGRGCLILSPLSPFFLPFKTHGVLPPTLRPEVFYPFSFHFFPLRVRTYAPHCCHFWCAYLLRSCQQAQSVPSLRLHTISRRRASHPQHGPKFDLLLSQRDTYVIRT